MDDNLEYFCNVDVPVLMTAGVDNLLDKEIVQWIVASAFQLGYKSKMLAGNDSSIPSKMSCFQVIELCTTPCNEGVRVEMKMSQEQPDNVAIFKKRFMECDWSGKLYLIESWNGKVENVTPDDHYITILLPDEY